MDLVYLYKRCPLSDIEIRFSLRSAEKFLKFDRVFIVGDKPKIFNDKVIHIKCADDQKNKHLNIKKKIDCVVNRADISDDFILMNDDFFLLKPFDTIPYFYNMTLKERVENPSKSEEYNKRIQAVYKVFPNGKSFEVHCPIVINKQKMKDLINRYSDKEDFARRSMYANWYIKERDQVKSKDGKIYLIEQIPKAEEVGFMSTDNIFANTTGFKVFISNKFREPSSYEVIQ